MDVFRHNRQNFHAVGRRYFLNENSPVSANEPDPVDSSAVAGIFVIMRRHGGGGVPAATGAYSLHVGGGRDGKEKRIRICAGDLEGLHHAIVTLIQLFRLFQSDDGLLPVYLSDRPSCAVRALMLDMNQYGRVPHFVSFRGSADRAY